MMVGALVLPPIKVGITDTGHGEDHCWRDHLTALVDLNSTTPFPPIVDAALLNAREALGRRMAETGSVAKLLDGVAEVAGEEADADGDAEQGQRAAQAVRGDRAQRQRDERE